MWLAGYVAASLLLFLCYVRVSRTVPVTADGGNNAMQAWDMLHGNWLLRGWVLGDASYYTTELPEYVLVEIFRGLSSEIVHICGAIDLHAARRPGQPCSQKATRQEKKA